MISSVLSYFDANYGPKILLQASELPEYIHIDHIPLLMDFYSGDFFIHEFGELKTVNLIFTVHNPRARGKEEMFMISLVFLNENTYQEEERLSSYKDVLNFFVDEFIKIKDVYKAFADKSHLTQESSEKFEKIKEIFYSFFQSIPREKAVFKLRNSRIFMYGLPQAGKTTIIKSLQQTFFSKVNLDKELSLRKLLLGNFSIITHNFSKKNVFHDLMSIYLREIDGIVFVLDVSNTMNFRKAQSELHTISKFPETHNLPLLILLNKIDLGGKKIKEIIDQLNIDQLKNKTIKFYPISAIKKEGIIEAFNWLSGEIVNSILKNPKKYFT